MHILVASLALTNNNGSILAMNDFCDDIVHRLFIGPGLGPDQW